MARNPRSWWRGTAETLRAIQADVALYGNLVLEGLRVIAHGEGER
jgi:hypothetical protein